MNEANWLSRLKAGLSKTNRNLSDGIAGIFTKRRLDTDTLNKLEEFLVQADLGTGTAARIVGAFGAKRMDKDITPQEVREALAAEIVQILRPLAQPLAIDRSLKPHVVLVAGVNGNGKTTTIGKLAHYLRKQQYSVMLAAADTFRAAAVEQLKIWGERTGCPVIGGEENADPASVVYKALAQAKAEGEDVLLIDSAGRLHNKANLMEELRKIIRVIRKLDASAPHSVILVLDATTGQNALAQAETFKSMIDVTGLVVTKLDGTAKGGIVVAIGDKFRLPVHAIGVGEGIEDFRGFNAEDFAAHLLAQA